MSKLQVILTNHEIRTAEAWKNHGSSLDSRAKAEAEIKALMLELIDELDDPNNKLTGFVMLRQKVEAL